MTAAQIVSLQVAAYNNRDIEANMALFSEDITFINFADGSVVVNGKESCREMYTLLFSNSPALFATIINRIDFGDKVLLHEYIYGRNGSNEKLEQVIIFEIKNEKIKKIVRL